MSHQVKPCGVTSGQIMSHHTDGTPNAHHIMMFHTDVRSLYLGNWPNVDIRTQHAVTSGELGHYVMSRMQTSRHAVSRHGQM